MSVEFLSPKHDVRALLYTVEPLYSNPLEVKTPLYTVEPLPLEVRHLCIQWNPSIPNPWNKDTSVYNETSLFQPLGMRNSNPWTSVYSITPLFQPLE